MYARVCVSSASDKTKCVSQRVIYGISWGRGCLLSTANTDTFQIRNTWGNFLFNLSVFKKKNASPFKKKKKSPLPPALPSFNLSWKYLSWIPLVSCNSPSSCFTVSGCQQWLIYFSSVGGIGAPTWHTRTRTRRGEGKRGKGGEGGRRGSGEHRCEVNFSQQQGKWDATLPSAPPLQVSVEEAGEKEGTWGFFFRGFHVYIHVNFSNMYEYMQETDMEKHKKVADKCFLTHSAAVHAFWYLYDATLKKTTTWNNDIYLKSHNLSFPFQ